MERHRNSIHLKLKQVCSICDKEFSNKDSLKRHINDVHEEKKKFKCPDCPLTFARSDNCNRHVEIARDNWRQHGVVKVCDACGENYVAPMSLCHPARGAAYVCTTCSKAKNCHESKKDDNLGGKQ